ncbi:MAG: Slp family lipoprotein [Nitrospiraceae bacterium]
MNHVPPWPFALATLIAVLVTTASRCEQQALFPASATDGIDRTFDVAAWQSEPNASIGRIVELGGAILQTEEKDGASALVIEHLPIVEHPAYGPRDTGRPSGEFVAVLTTPIPRTHLRPGNRIIVIGTTQSAIPAMVDGIRRPLPTVQVRCIHIWNTGGKEIADFPWVGAGYEPLEENIYCADGF